MKQMQGTYGILIMFLFYIYVDLSFTYGKTIISVHNQTCIKHFVIYWIILWKFICLLRMWIAIHITKFTCFDLCCGVWEQNSLLIEIFISLSYAFCLKSKRTQGFEYNGIRFDHCGVYVFRARKWRFLRRCDYFCQRFFLCDHSNLHFFWCRNFISIWCQFAHQLF